MSTGEMAQHVSHQWPFCCCYKTPWTGPLTEERFYSGLWFHNIRWSGEFKFTLMGQIIRPLSCLGLICLLKYYKHESRQSNFYPAIVSMHFTNGGLCSAQGTGGDIWFETCEWSRVCCHGNLCLTAENNPAHFPIVDLFSSSHLLQEASLMRLFSIHNTLVTNVLMCNRKREIFEIGKLYEKNCKKRSKSIHLYNAAGYHSYL